MSFYTSDLQKNCTPASTTPIIYKTMWYLTFYKWSFSPGSLKWNRTNNFSGTTSCMYAFLVQHALTSEVMHALNFLQHTSHFFPFMASFPAALSKANRRIRKDLCQKNPWPFKNWLTSFTCSAQQSMKYAGLKVFSSE